MKLFGMMQGKKRKKGKKMTLSLVGLIFIGAAIVGIITGTIKGTIRGIKETREYNKHMNYK
jgi:uncharacterized membrane protein